MKRILICACVLTLCLCALPVRAAYNHAPTVEGALCETAENVPLYGSLRTYDPEGDEIFVLVTRSPGKGQVSFEGAAFRYIPFPDETGEDSFAVVAHDRYGNRSKEAVVSISRLAV